MVNDNGKRQSVNRKRNNVNTFLPMKCFGVSTMTIDFCPNASWAISRDFIPIRDEHFSRIIFMQNPCQIADTQFYPTFRKKLDRYVHASHFLPTPSNCRQCLVKIKGEAPPHKFTIPKIGPNLYVIHQAPSVG